MIAVEHLVTLSLRAPHRVDRRGRRQLGYTPSAVSQQVKRLERRVGGAVLDRSAAASSSPSSGGTSSTRAATSSPGSRPWIGAGPRRRGPGHGVGPPRRVLHGGPRARRADAAPAAHGRAGPRRHGRRARPARGHRPRRLGRRGHRARPQLGRPAPALPGARRRRHAGRRHGRRPRPGRAPAGRGVDPVRCRPRRRGLGVRAGGVGVPQLAHPHVRPPRGPSPHQALVHGVLLARRARRRGRLREPRAAAGARDAPAVGHRAAAHRPGPHAEGDDDVAPLDAPSPASARVREALGAEAAGRVELVDA